MAIPHPLVIFFIVLVGLSFGSFGTMLLYRLPRGKSLLGRSACTACNHTLHWYDLVPIVSFLLLGGHCRYCNAHISWRYPCIETTTALLLTLLIIRIDPTEWMIALLLIISIFSLVLIAFYDFETQKIPDIFIVVLLLSALLYQSALSAQGNPDTMRGAFLGAAIPLFFFGSLWLISRRQWIGSGDILLGIGIGILLSWKLTILSLFFAYTMGAIAAMFLLILGVVKRGSTIPFGPFLASGALFALFAGKEFLLQYQRIFL